MIRIPTTSVHAAVLALALIAGAVPSSAQQADPPPAFGVKESELDKHLDELNAKLDSMHRQLIESQNEMDELRKELHSLREQLTEKDQGEQAARDADSLRAGVAQLQEQTDLLQAEVKQHDQTKVESSSKYPVRVNGAILFTSFLNSHTPDNVNLPIVALPTSAQSLTGSLSATARQTILGIDSSGPRLWGASSFADLNVDFWGGSTLANYSATAWTLRLRTAHARLDWPTRSLAVALDRPLISPWQPTSWVTVAEPALAWSGNLWTWLPQLEFKQNGFPFARHVNVDLGLIDVAAPSNYTTNQPGGGSSPSERSRQPGYEARIGSSFNLRDRPLSFGASGYYSRQAYTYDHHVDAWAGAADWDLPLAHVFKLSGQLYRGRAIGGLGGGAFKDYVSQEATESLRGLNAEGGWAQAKFTFSSSIEANISGGLDNAFAADLRGSDQSMGSGYYSALDRNQTVLGNLIYRPKTYLLLSAEFRQISSRSITGYVNQDRILGLATGYIF